MRNGILRVSVAILALVSVELGVGATFAPRSFFDDYPGLGRHWVRAYAPYNEHLVRDFGALNLALAVMTIAALITLGRPLLIAVAIAWLAWGVPHLVYHLRHLDVLSTGDKVANVVGLVAVPVLAVVVLVLALGRPARA